MFAVANMLPTPEPIAASRRIRSSTWLRIFVGHYVFETKGDESLCARTKSWPHSHAGFTRSQTS